MGKGFAATITSRGGFHQSRIQCVLHIATQNTVFDEDIALSRVTFVINIERTASVFNSAVINHGDTFRGNALTNATRKHTRTFTVKVAFETMSNGLVQENPRPTCTEDNSHFTCRCSARIEIDHGLMHSMIHILLEECIRKIGQSKTPTATAMTGFATSITLNNHGKRHAYERSDIRSQATVRARYHHHIVFHP